jgi:hypothetical protein
VGGDLETMSPIAPDWFMWDGTYSTPTRVNPLDLQIPWLNVSTTSETEAVWLVLPPDVSPGSYTGAIADMTTLLALPQYIQAASASYTLFPFTDNINLGTITGLTPGKTYTLRIRAHSSASGGGTYGEYKYFPFTMPKAANVASVSDGSNPTNSPDLGNSGTAVPTGSSFATAGIRTVSRSLLSVSNLDKDKSSISLIEKTVSLPTSYSHYSFGGAFFFDSVTKAPVSAGGLGFFTSNQGKTGYFIEIKTDSSFGDTKDQAVKIFKCVDGNRKKLVDSQEGKTGKLYGGVIQSSSYKLDIKVKRSATQTIIDVYINGFKISAIDEYSTNVKDGPLEKAIPVTAGMALFCSLTKISFDYIYAIPLEESQYNEFLISDIYSGHYGSKTLSFAYGDKLINSSGTPAVKNAYIEEFGTVARELRRVKVNYAQTAGIPKYATVGVNKFAEVLGSRLTNHGAEIFVINNAGTFIPLQSGAHSFYVIGDFVSITGQHEYTESTTNEFTNLEPASFESTWIQNEGDAKSLFTWIKDQWSKQQLSISMEVFGNPVLEPGDVITINYPKNNLDGTQKFVITNVDNSFEGGLSTTISARSIYS